MHILNLLISVAQAHGEEAEDFGHGMMGFWGGGMFFGWIFWIILIAIAAIIIFSLANRVRQKESQEKSALEILNQRLAKGEIKEDEYEKKKQKISNQ